MLAMEASAMRLSALLKDNMTSVWCVLDPVVVHWLCSTYCSRASALQRLHAARV